MLDVNSMVRELRGSAPVFPGLNVLDPVIVYLMGCLDFDQFCCTWRGLADQERFCPFCPAELIRRRRKPIRRTDKWLLLQNEFPRDDAEHMLLIIPTRHIISGEELTGSDWADVWTLFAYYLEEFVRHSGTFVMRHGDPRDNARTIEHLHINLIQPKREGGMSVPLAKTVEEHQADYARLFDFAKEIDERGGMEWLFSPEGIAETQPRVTD